MKLEISEKDIKEIILNSTKAEFKDRVEDQICDVMDDDEIQSAMKKVILDFIKSDEGKEIIKKSFLKEYINNGSWIEYDNICEAIDEEAITLVKEIFKNINFNFIEKKNV